MAITFVCAEIYHQNVGHFPDFKVANQSETFVIWHANISKCLSHVKFGNLLHLTANKGYDKKQVDTGNLKRLD